MKRGFLRGAAYLSIASILCKVLGAAYRVPLTNILGAEGIGAYQMVFPVYTVLLTLSSTGIPNALAKTIAEGKDARSILRKSLLFFGSAGFVFSLAVYLLAGPIARLQGNPSVAAAYKALSPSVFFVSVISCFRGYRQGLDDMLPTALSQITEQTVKLAFGLTLCSLFGTTAYEKAAIATLSVTLSEAAALVFIIFFKRKDVRVGGENSSLKSILAVVFPVTLSAIALPISRTVDGFLAVNLISAERSVATARFGLYSGATESVVSVPIALCYAVAVSSVPRIAADKTSVDMRFKPIFLTLAIGSVAAVGVYFSAGLIVRTLYSSLDGASRQMLAMLIKTSAAQVIGLGLVQTCSAVLVALDKPFLSCAHLALGVVAKTVFTYVFVPNGYGVFGCALADTFTYLIVAALDLFSIIRLGRARSTVLKGQRTPI